MYEISFSDFVSADRSKISIFYSWFNYVTINMVKMVVRIIIAFPNWHNYKAIVVIFLCHNYYDLLFS